MSKSRHTYWSGQFANLVSEMSRLCIACDIKMLEPGVFERVLSGDPTVCGRQNPESFRKLRQHLMAYCHLEESAIKRLGADEARTILDEVRDSIVKLRGTE